MDSQEMMSSALSQLENSKELVRRLPCNSCGNEYDSKYEINKYIKDKNNPYYYMRQDYNCQDCCDRLVREKKEELLKEKAESDRLFDEAVRVGPSVRLTNIPHIMRSILPPKFAAMEYPLSKSLEKYIPPTEKGLCLCGKSGAGKTSAISMLIREFLIRESRKDSPNTWGNWPTLGWMFISYPEFIRKLQHSFKEKKKGEGESAADILEEAMSSPFLVIDDLGAEKPTDYVRQETYALINHREMYLLPTYITTNFSLDFLDKNIDPRIASRIAGMCDIVKVEGNDKRLL